MIKIIPNARPRRARNTDTEPPQQTQENRISKNRLHAKKKMVIFPELTDQDTNYAEIENQQITIIPAAQPKLQEAKHLANTNINISIGSTLGPTFSEYTGEATNIL